MEFAVKVFVIMVELSRMARAVLGSHKISAVSTKQFSAKYAFAVSLNSLLLMALVVHYHVAKSKGLFVHNRRHYIVVSFSVAYDYAHILAVGYNFCKGIDVNFAPLLL